MGICPTDPGGSPAASPQRKAASLAAGPQFTAATLNLGDASLATDITGLARDRGVTVIGLQEAGDRNDLLDRVRDRAGMASWRWCRVDAPDGLSVPIMYDSDVWSLETGCGGFLAVESRFLGPGGAGPDESKPKYVTAFVLHHRASGRNVRVLNTHFIPSARRNDIGDAEKQRRVAHVKDHVTALVDRIGRQATHPKTGEAIDHVVRRNLVNVSRVNVNTASDHHAVVNRLEF